jgi:tetraacyldisaccharide 4'-kinase
VIGAILSTIYGAGVSLRNAGYDRGIFRTHRVAASVISIGNLSVGGTGKTPLVMHLAERMLGHRRTALVTRGYRRTTRGTFLVSDGAGAIADTASSGDEPAMVARRLPALVVIADEQRVRGCRFAIDRFRVSRIILDDAFQHRACARDVDIVVVDASRDRAEDRLLPAGRLREPMASLSRASMVVLSRCADTVSGGEALALIRRYTDAPVFLTRFVTADIAGMDGGFGPPSALAGRRLLTFCGIGAPRSFRQTMLDLGVESVHHETFPDHFAYTDDAVAHLARLATTHRADGFLTTEKDAVRLEPFRGVIDTRPLYYPRLRLDFLDGEREFFSMIEQRCAHG